jgi:uncharacterized membrane protein YphA (DoxX/SURF4 family)
MKAVVNYPEEASSTNSRSFARYFPAIARILMGLSLLVFGLNGFLNFMPPPKTPLPEGAMTFVTALVKSGYMMKLIAVTQLVVGALLVVNRFVPLAILLLAPFLVNSLAFHLFLERSGLVMSMVFCALELYLAWVYRRAYAPLFVARTGPA